MKNADRPAMPIPLNAGEAFQGHGNADGFTKLEMMAMAVMQGVVSKYHIDDYSHGEMARISIQLADALLEQLEKKGGDRWSNAHELPNSMTRDQFVDQYFCEFSASDAPEDQNKEGREA